MAKLWLLRSQLIIWQLICFQAVSSPDGIAHTQLWTEKKSVRHIKRTKFQHLQSLNNINYTITQPLKQVPIKFSNIWNLINYIELSKQSFSGKKRTKNNIYRETNILEYKLIIDFVHQQLGISHNYIHKLNGFTIGSYICQLENLRYTGTQYRHLTNNSQFDNHNSGIKSKSNQYDALKSNNKSFTPNVFVTGNIIFMYNNLSKKNISIIKDSNLHLLKVKSSEVSTTTISTEARDVDDKLQQETQTSEDMEWHLEEQTALEATMINKIYAEQNLSSMRTSSVCGTGQHLPSLHGTSIIQQNVARDEVGHHLYTDGAYHFNNHQLVLPDFQRGPA